MKCWFLVWKWKMERASSLDWRVENSLYEGAHPLGFLKALMRRVQTEGTEMEYRMLWWTELDQKTYDSVQELKIDRRS